MKDTKPSQTAVWIAKGLLYLNQMGRLTDDSASKSVELWKNVLERVDPEWLVLLQNRGYRCWFGLIERVTIPGLFAHYAARKKIIDEWVKQALNNNVEQVIILAAGFDTLMLRYCSQFPNVQFVEIDHPATQAIKTQAFSKANPLAPNVTFVAADFQKQTLKSVLAEHCHAELKTLIIAEGITMYLTENEVRTLFSDIHDFFKNQTQFVFTFMEKRADGDIQFANATFMVNWWLAIHKETFRWGIEPALLEKHLLNPLGFTQRALQDPALGEWVCLSEVTHD